jgi:multidrug efflux system outer membrane protein
VYSQGVLASEMPWAAFVLDEKIRKIIELGLANNRDIRITLANIESARAKYKIQNAAILPTIEAGVSATRGRSAAVSPNGDISTSNVKSYSATVGMSAYEVDLFGKVRSLSQVALETYLATEDAHRAAKISLISELTSAYQTLAADISQLQLAKNTMDSAQSSMLIIQKRLEIGVATRLEFRQAETVYQTARADVANYTTLVAQARNAVELLAGMPVPDGLIPEGLPNEAIWFADISAGLDSSVLLSRPDVSQAEHQLKSADANISAARAAFFPSLKLTASTGLASAELLSLFSGAGVWSIIPSLTVPIFDNGNNQANLDAAKAQQKVYLSTYELTLQTAFKEVADALARKGTIKEQLTAQQKLVEAASDSYMIANERYKKGVASYLDALDAQRTLYEAQKALIAVKLVEYENQQTLYRVLGGGIKVAS